MDPASFPNADVRVTDDFLRRHEPLFIVLSLALLQGAIESPGAVDSDVREAIESLIRTQRTAASGLVYETKPANLIAAGVQALFQEQLDEVKDRAAKQGASILDVEVLGMLVFLQRLAINHDNGRKYGRAFIDLLRTQFPGAKPKGEPDAGSLIVSA